MDGCEVASLEFDSTLVSFPTLYLKHHMSSYQSPCFCLRGSLCNELILNERPFLNGAFGRSGYVFRYEGIYHGSNYVFRIYGLLFCPRANCMMQILRDHEIGNGRFFDASFRSIMLQNLRSLSNIGTWLQGTFMLLSVVRTCHHKPSPGSSWCDPPKKICACLRCQSCQHVPSMLNHAK